MPSAAGPSAAGPSGAGARIAVLDYGMGNLFSVAQACQQAGLFASITSDSKELLAADGVILPGVGAFGDAMDNLNRLDLVGPLREIAASKKPFMGICLGMQLLLTESQEFGNHKGLGIIEGQVLQLQVTAQDGRALKVPQVGWNQIHRSGAEAGSPAGHQAGRLASHLDSIEDGEYMYFVHSYYPRPQSPAVVVTTTSYGPLEFCSSLRRDSLFACQFHPERSGQAGLQMYRNFARIISEYKETHDAHQGSESKETHDD